MDQPADGTSWVQRFRVSPMPGDSPPAILDDVNAELKRRTVLIVDDSAKSRRGLKALLSTCSDVEIVGEAADGREAIQMVCEHRPDVVLMDIQMPAMDGLEATRLIKKDWPECRVVILTMHAHYSRDAMEAGANDFVQKGEPLERLLATIAGG